MRKETNKLRNSVWKDILKIIKDFRLTPFFEINRTEFRITSLINGTEIICVGLDDGEKIKGFSDISDVFLDEVTAFSPDDIRLIDGTVRSNRFKLPLQLYFAFNPISKVNFVYKYFGFESGSTPKDTFIHHSTYKDNTYLDKSFIKRMENLKEENYTLWQIESEGLFASLDKLIYTRWDVQAFDWHEMPGVLCCG